MRMISELFQLLVMKGAQFVALGDVAQKQGTEAATTEMMRNHRHF